MTGVASMPSLECDLIMKGGVTSGVVYPPAILRLAQVYRFRCIGGASAGAIGAVLAAAAEYGRARAPRDSSAGFSGLAKLNEVVAQPGFLRRRLKALPPFRPLLRAVFTYTGWPQTTGGPWSRKVVRLPRLPAAIFVAAPLAVLVGAAVGALLSVPLARALSVYHAVLGPFVLSIGAIAAALLAAAVAIVRRVARASSEPRANFGWCSGSDGVRVDLTRDEELALTDWLHVWINRLAALPLEGPPLTVRQLHEDADIELKLMSTNLSVSRALVLPLARGSRSFFFRREDVVELFPPSVVAYLLAWAEQHPTSKLRLPPNNGYYLFPFGRDLPVVVAARFSLGFPVLFSALKLYSFKNRAYDASARGELVDLEHDVEEHFFSDGGIASNFPVHLFDRWVPRRPTFGITLYDSPVSSVLAQREEPAAVVLPRPRDFDHARPPRTRVAGVADLLRAVFDTAQSHRDFALSGLPSYRERVAQIFLSASEGGLNLGMSTQTIAAVQSKGKQAAEQLIVRYVDDRGNPSDLYGEHLWVRTLVLLGQLEKQFAEVRTDLAASAWKNDAAGRYDELLDAQLAARARGEAWYRDKDEAWCNAARRRYQLLLDLIEAWPKDAVEPCFSAQPPRPEGQLRVTPET
jgi:predicted acylesterase/phospholipase RssA